MKKSVWSLVLALAGACTLMGGDTTCVGFLTGAHDNVVVPRNAFCLVQNAQIKGNVKVFGSLEVRGFPQTTIGGSIDGEPGHGFVRLFGFGGPVTVEGNIQLKGATQPSGLNGPNVFLRQNFQYEENRGSLFVFNSTIGGNLKMEKNIGGGGSIFFNAIGGNLQCKENDPPPVGFGNAVRGNKEDQCATF